MPNSGKSTLISVISRARPKIADYPFTTKVPALGVVRLGMDFDMVVADIPGLIEDAHKGAGMGDRFLKHIERTKVLLHLIDPAPHIEPRPEERFTMIMNELDSYGAGLAEKPTIAVITKNDLPENQGPSEKLTKWLQGTGMDVFVVSAATGQGIDELLKFTAQTLRKQRIRERRVASEGTSASGA